MENNRIRVICVEAEASDEAVREVLRTLSFAPLAVSAVAAPLEAGRSLARLDEALRKRPMTSGDLIRVTGLTPPSVYTMLTTLRGEGVVVSREGDTSFKVNHVVEAK